MIRTKLTLVCLLSVACALPAHAADSVKFKPTGGGYKDVKNVPLKNPEGVACSNGNVVVADTGNGRFVRFTLANDDLKDGVEFKVAEITYPIRLKAAQNGRVLVLDGKTRKISRVSADGSFAGYVDYQNVPAPSEVTPRSMAVDSKDNVYVLDIFGERVLVVDSSGKYLRQIPFPKDYGFFSDVAVDHRGVVYILDSLKSTVYKAVPDATAFQVFSTGLQSYLAFAASLDVDSQGRVYLLDQDDSAVILLGPDGSFQGRYLSFGWRGSQLNHPTQSCFTKNDTLVIADRNNSRIQLFKVQ